LKVKYDELLSNFAFKCKLRHYIVAFSRHCETLDVYGFTTDVSAGPYWFTGRKVGHPVPIELPGLTALIYSA